VRPPSEHTRWLHYQAALTNVAASDEFALITLIVADDDRPTAESA
jgi:hypothetical protein